MAASSTCQQRGRSEDSGDRRDPTHQLDKIQLDSSILVDSCSPRKMRKLRGHLALPARM